MEIPLIISPPVVDWSAGSQVVKGTIPVKTFVLPTREQIDARYSFPTNIWTDSGSYWLNNAAQGTDVWKLSRKFRVTSSNFGGAVGKSNLSSPMQIAMDSTNVKLKTFSEVAKQRMSHGTAMESIARQHYCTTRAVEVYEIGCAVPKWEVRIGTSTDGVVIGTSGIIEIKCPKEMYIDLILYQNKVSDGWIPPSFYHNHIQDSHYYQMQGCMKILEKEWCDYIVYATDSNAVFIERIYFNQSFWEDILWPELQNFLNNILEPLIADGANSHLILTIPV